MGGAKNARTFGEEMRPNPPQLKSNERVKGMMSGRLVNTSSKLKRQIRIYKRKLELPTSLERNGQWVRGTDFPSKFDLHWKSDDLQTVRQSKTPMNPKKTSFGKFVTYERSATENSTASADRKFGTFTKYAFPSKSPEKWMECKKEESKHGPHACGLQMASYI